MIKRLKELLKQLRANPLYQKYELFVLPGFSAVVCLVLIIMVIIPNVSAFLSTNSKISSLSARNTALSTKAKALEQVDTQTVKNNIQTALLALPNDKDVPNALNQLLFLVNNNALSLTGISFSPGQPAAAGASSYQIKMDVTGDLIHLRNFVNSLKDSIPLIKPDSIEITGIKFSDVQSTIAVAIYFQPDQKNIGDIEKPLPVITQKDLEPLDKIKDAAENNAQVSNQLNNAPRGKSDPFR